MSERPKRSSTSRSPGSRGAESRRGRGPAGPRSSGPRSTAPGRTGAASGAAVRRPRQRPRVTGRAAILILVLAVLTVSYASSMRAYLQQRAHIADLRAKISEKTQGIEELEREKRRWHDDNYVESQARERFNYVMPGETGYRAIDENGEPLDATDELTDPEDLPQAVPEAWWSVAWESVLVAGDPDEYGKDDPAETIKAPRE